MAIDQTQNIIKYRPYCSTYTKDAQKVLQHFLYFSQNQQEMSVALLWLIFNVLLATVVQQINRYRVVKITFYGNVLLKQQAVIGFLVAENESVTNIHQQLKNVYGVRVFDKSTVSH